MDFITYLIQNIKRHIPKQVLDLAFIREANSYYTTSLDDRIKQKVLKEFFLVDLALMHGVEVEVHYSELDKQVSPEGTTILKVPSTVTGGRTITTILSATTPDIYPTRNTSTEEMYQNRLHDNLAGHFYDSTVRMDVIGPDEILVYSETANITNMTFKLLLNYSADYNEIRPMYYIKLSNAVVLAAKSIVYNELIVSKGQAFLFNGAEMPVIDDIIEKYEGAIIEYEDMQARVKKMLFMNDTKSMNHYVKSHISNNS